MASARCKYALLAFLFLGLLAFAGYLGSDRGLHGLVRPALERALSAGLGGEVSIAELDLDLHSLRIAGLELQRQDQLRLQLQAMEAEFSWADLLKRRLGKLHLVSPHLEIVRSGESGGDGLPLPAFPPLQIDDLLIEQGRINLSLQNTQLLLQQITFRTALGENFSFFGSAALGVGVGLPLEVGGRGTWNKEITLTLERFVLDSRSLLASPVELSLATGKNLDFVGQLSWPGFSSDDLQKIGAALGVAMLSADDWQFATRQAVLRFGGGGEDVELQLSLGGARIVGKGLVLPLEQGRLSLQGRGGRWQGQGEWALAEGYSGALNLALGQKGLEGRVSQALGEPGALLETEFIRNDRGEIFGTGKVKRFTHRHLERFALLLGLDNPLPADISVELEVTGFGFCFKDGQFDLQLGLARGLAKKKALQLPFNQLQAELHSKDGRWGGRGRLRVAESVPVDWTLSFAEGNLNGQLDLAADDLAATVLRLKGGSRLPVSGGLHLHTDIALLKGRWSLKTRMEGQKGKGPGFNISRLAADISLQGAFENLFTEVSLMYQGRVLASARGPWNRLEFEMPPQRWDHLQGLLGAIKLPAGLEAIEGLAAAGRLTFSPKQTWQLQGRVAADRVGLKGGVLEAVRVQGRIRPEGELLLAPELTVSGRLNLKGTSIGALEAAMTGSYRSGAFGLGIERLSLAEIEYLSPDGLSGMAGGTLQLAGKLTGSVNEQMLDWNLQGRGRATEVLHGAFYADFSKLPMEFEFDGDVDGEAARLNFRRLLLQIEGAGELRLAGALTTASQQVSARFELSPLEGSLAQVLRASLAAYAPSLKELQLRGAMGGELALSRRGKTWQLQGKLLPSGFGLDWPRGKIRVQGGRGLIPLVVSSGAKPEVEGRGRLYLEGLSLGPASYSGSVGILATVNRVRFLDPLEFKLTRGQVRLAEVGAGFGPKGLEFAGRIQVAKVDLEALATELELPRMTGRIDADLGQIRYADGVLSSEGQAQVRAFGGSLKVSGLRYENPFSSYPTLHGDIEFSGLDLHQLTHTFAFGEMNGVVDGYIRNLRLFGRTPSQFVAEVRTRPKGRRNISVKALKNLTLLSQGGLSAALSRGVYRFIDFYRYRQIGIRCTLDRDIFNLRGTARSGSERHLVYGGLLPPKIDILAPAQAISFKEMVKRLGRIERTGN